MDGPGDGSEKDKYQDISYMQNQKIWYKWTYLQNRNRHTDLENELMVTGVRVEGGINWVIEIDIYTLLYLK